jgi:hypothetical protein
MTAMTERSDVIDGRGAEDAPMRGKHAEPDDPMELRGVALPATRAAIEDMAYAFAEEFARLGRDERWLLGVFRSPFYAGPHQAHRVLGDDAIRAIVRECLQAFGRGRCDEPRAAEGA